MEGQSLTVPAGPTLVLQGHDPQAAAGLLGHTLILLGHGAEDAAAPWGAHFGIARARFPLDTATAIYPRTSRSQALPGLTCTAKLLADIDTYVFVRVETK